MLAAYPLPTPIIGLLSGFLTPRIGGRRMALAGSVLLTVSTLAFAFAPNAVVLDLARGVQGCAAGITWAASMAWLSANTPRDRLARETGIVMGLFSIGRRDRAGHRLVRPCHLARCSRSRCLAGAAALTIPLAWRAPAGVKIPREQQLRALDRLACCATASCVAAILLSVIDPISLGAIDLLVPRHLHGHGVPTWHIGAALMIGAALGAVAGPLAGRRADRVGPLRVGLVAATVLVILPDGADHRALRPAQLVLLVVLAPAFTILSTAMYPLSTSGADARGVSHGVVNGVISVTWATAFAVGSLRLGPARRPPRRHGHLRRRRRRLRIAARDARDRRPRGALRAPRPT